MGISRPFAARAAFTFSRIFACRAFFAARSALAHSASSFSFRFRTRTIRGRSASSSSLSEPSSPGRTLRTLSRRFFRFVLAPVDLSTSTSRSLSKSSESYSSTLSSSARMSSKLSSLPSLPSSLPLESSSSPSSPRSLSFFAAFRFLRRSVSSRSFPFFPPTSRALIFCARDTSVPFSSSGCLNWHSSPNLHLPRLHQSKQVPLSRTSSICRRYSLRSAASSLSRASRSARSFCKALNASLASRAARFFSATPSLPPAFSNFAL